MEPYPFPHARGQVTNTVTTQEPPSVPIAEEPIVKKKDTSFADKRKVLNKTYARTPFPSIEECAELARKLDIPPQGVRDWFRDKNKSAQSEDTGYSSYDDNQSPTKPYTYRFDAGFSDPSTTGVPTQKPASALVNKQPVIKTKGMIFDAAQLKVLNEMYASTAFPSSGECAKLARELHVSTGRVQMWFLTKRLSMQRTRGQVASTAMSEPHQPF
ncbi:hypothetical protein HD554DRAFT_318301 [Boletus coccyginus]|nr:hypothetical protein HD554DRAFT_318301 [Boletus coccyginus]